MSVSFIVAYVGGLLTLFAPCAALLIPGFFSYAFTSRRQLLRMTLIFLLGLEAVLIPLGFAAGSVGGFLRHNMSTVTLVGGIIIAVLGLLQAFGFTASLGTNKANRKPRDKTSVLGVFLLGASYGLAGVGCAGPIMGSVLTMAGIGGTSWQAAITMAVYGLGVFTPVFVLATLWDVLNISESRLLRPRSVRFLGRDTTWGNLFSGAVFIALGTWLAVYGVSGGTGLISTDEQYRIENETIAALDWVENWMFLALLAIVVLLVVGIRMLRRKPAEIDVESAVAAALRTEAAPGTSPLSGPAQAGPTEPLPPAAN